MSALLAQQSTQLAQPNAQDDGDALALRYGAEVSLRGARGLGLSVAPVREADDVVFEAAVVPHEVTAVVAGERLALFGFFAEDRTIPTAWRDPEGEDSDIGPWFHDGWAVTDC